MSRLAISAPLILFAWFAAIPCAAEEQEILSVSDLDFLRAVSEVRISPDGSLVAYVVGRVNIAADRQDSGLSIVHWDQSVSIDITPGHASAYMPRWSPDSKQLAFLSSGLSSGETPQLWLHDREKGSNTRITNIAGEISDISWAPTSDQLVLVVETPDAQGGTEEPIRPIVVDRFHFKSDGRGYLDDARRHLQLVDIASGAVQVLTDGPYDELMPAWAPDGSRIAFVSKRGADPDRHVNWEVFSIAPEAGADAQRLTKTEYAESSPDGWGGPPTWSRDSRHLIYTLDRDPKLSYYALSQLGIVAAEGGPAEILTDSLDRNVMQPKWSADGKSIYFLLEDDMSVYLAQMPATGGPVTRLTAGGRTVKSFDVSASGNIVLIFGTSEQPYEVGALEKGRIRRLSHENDDWLAKARLGKTTEMSFSSPDGTEIHGFMMTPPDFSSSKLYPTILRIHGGPVGQFRHEFKFDWQLFAANGYVVLGVNPRGSSGRGEEFQRAIFADYGIGDVPDVLAAVDYVIDAGIADENRLGIGGKSYGSMLTNYTIASDSRFKAATSHAGVSNMLALYGTDEWVRHWEFELGRPWENPEAWLRLSYPFLHADRITTPTLFLCGDKDANVPLANSEQMYQALQSLGVTTQLVVYPGEGHYFVRPSFKRDILERYVDWYDRFLK